MTKRIDSIIKLLVKRNDYVPVDIICDQIGIRPRTLREDIRNNRKLLANEAGLSLEMKSNLGYRILIHDENKYFDYLQNKIHETAQNQFVLPVDQEERVEYIIRFFLGKNAFVKSDDLAEAMYISRSTLSSDLKRVKEVLQEYDLSLESKVGHGLKIMGSERKIRSCISDFYFNKDVGSITESLLSVNDSFERINLIDISGILYRIISNYRFKMNDIGYQNLVIHLAIATVRIQEETYVGMNQTPEFSLDGFIEYEIAKEIAHDLGTYYLVDFPTSEIAYIAMHLMGKRVYSLDDDKIIDVDTLNIVNEILHKIKNSRNISLFGDTELFTMLALHIQPLKMRLGYDMRLHNPLLDSIKNNNVIAFELATLAGSVINEHMNSIIDEDELGYLALHFELALTRLVEDSMQRKNIAVVCASGAGTSKFLIHKIKEVFGSQIRSIISLSAFELQNVEKDSLDLIISTIPLNDVTDIPTIQVHYQLNELDIENLKRAVHHQADVGTIQSCFSESLFFANMPFTTKDDVINYMVHELEKSIPLPTGFIESVHEREAIAATDLGNGVAMPHPSKLMLEENIIVFCHLEKPIQWGRQKANLVFLLGFAKEYTEETDALQHALFEIYGNVGAMIQLQQEPTFKTLMDLIANVSDYDEGEIFK